MPIGHPVFWLLLAAVLAPVLAQIPIGLKVPVVVLEVVLGIIIGPHVLDLVQFDGILEPMFRLGMAATLFMAGVELDFSAMKGRPLSLALGGWSISLLLGVAAVGLLHIVPGVDAPMMVVAGGLHDRAGRAAAGAARRRATGDAVRTPGAGGGHASAR